MKLKNKDLISKLVICFSDIIFINVPLFISVFVMDSFFGGIDKYISLSEFLVRIYAQLALSILCVLWFLIRLRHYTYRKTFWFELKEVIRTLVIFSILDLALVAFSKWDFSRTLWVTTWLIIFILVPFGRVVSKFVLNKLNLWGKQTVIIGTGKNAKDTYSALQSDRMLGLKVAAFVSVARSSQSADSIFGLPIIANVESLWDLIDVKNTQFILALEPEQHEIRDNWLKLLSKHKCRSVSVIPTLRGVPLYGTDMSFIFSHEIMILRVNNNMAKMSSRFIKRSFDIVGSLLILFLLSPVLIFIAYKVSRDGGSAIYGHERIGFNGKKFKCLKFRSMCVNSKEILDDILKNDPVARAEWEKDFKLKDDPRITRIGAFIRKTSLDELPQLLNVLLGQMSLVGPRPVVEVELERYAGDVEYYLMAKPGMTGLWQVSGRNDVDYETRVYFDAWYVKNWALWNDIVILMKTIGVVLKREGAY
ncbi:undecaprenyl-phosphate galactose phosphotransferase WbaP [Serratia sp. IR-2025]|uniref:undecaprenyl-phosphate galactose phosphotransferase WbaP n=1 Tax=Serratia marcescens TaxID=615 RepID=UPI00387932C0